MLRTLAQRLVQAVIVLAGVMLLIFVMLRIVPGNPVETLMGEHANQETIARVSEEMGLDQPLHIQFFRYLSSALRGDFGTSFTLGKPVSRLLRSAFVNTLILALFAALFAWIIGIGCGVLAAVTKNRLPDRIFTGFSLLGISLPVFMAAMFLQYVFAFRLHWLPISGADSWTGFILPGIALGWNSAGQIAQMTRVTLLETLQEDYIDTALAKGLSPARTVVRHALRNAMLPVLTIGAGDLRAGYSAFAGNRPVYHRDCDSGKPGGRLPVRGAGSPDPEGGLRDAAFRTEKDGCPRQPGAAKPAGGGNPLSGQAAPPGPGKQNSGRLRGADPGDGAGGGFRAAADPLRGKGYGSAEPAEPSFRRPSAGNG